MTDKAAPGSILKKLKELYKKNKLYKNIIHIESYFFYYTS
jgi:hypothetical protein